MPQIRQTLMKAVQAIVEVLFKEAKNFKINDKNTINQQNRYCKKSNNDKIVTR
jgi:hypothetical protein